MDKQKCLAALSLILVWFASSFVVTASAAPPDVAATAQDSAVSAGHLETDVHAQLERVGRRLNLSQAQRASIQKILDAQLPSLHALMHTLYKNRRALQTMTADDPNLDQLAAIQGKTVGDIILLRKRIQTEVSKQLTENQRRQLHLILKRRCHHSHPAHHTFGHLWWLSPRRR